MPGPIGSSNEFFEGETYATRDASGSASRDRCRGHLRRPGCGDANEHRRDREGPRQPLHDQGRRRQYRCVRHRQRRRPRRHQARELGSGDHGSGAVGDRQTRHHDHQHAHPWRSHWQQRVLPGVGRGGRAREHQDEHAQDEAVRGREGAVPARPDLQGSFDAASPGPTASTCTISGPATRTATRSSSFPRCAWPTPATSSPGRRLRSSI